MQKTWIDPTIEELDINATAKFVKDGKVSDWGEYDNTTGETNYLYYVSGQESNYNYKIDK
jgi:hypothetical protein